MLEFLALLGLFVVGLFVLKIVFGVLGLVFHILLFPLRILLSLALFVVMLPFLILLVPVFVLFGIGMAAAGAFALGVLGLAWAI